MSDINTLRAALERIALNLDEDGYPIIMRRSEMEQIAHAALAATAAPAQAPQVQQVDWLETEEGKAFRQKMIDETEAAIALESIAPAMPQVQESDINLPSNWVVPITASGAVRTPVSPPALREAPAGQEREAKEAAIALWKSTGEQLKAAGDTLRAISSSLGQGGCWDTENLDYDDMQKRIMEGIDEIIKVEISRASQPPAVQPTQQVPEQDSMDSPCSE